MTKRRIILTAFIVFDIALFAVFIGAAILRNTSSSLSQNELSDLGVALIPERAALADFNLTDHKGNDFSNRDLLGNWNVIFFGFTSCPDVCPLTMNALQLFYLGLEDSDFAEDTRIIMVSVDPARDTVEKMASYVTGYHEDFVGLTGASEVIAGLASELYIAFTEPPMHDTHDEDGDYIIQHSGYIVIVGPDGIYRGVIRAPHTKESLTLAYNAIRKN